MWLIYVSITLISYLNLTILIIKIDIYFNIWTFYNQK